MDIFGGRQANTLFQLQSGLGVSYAGIYRLGPVNSNTVNSKFHLIRTSKHKLNSK